MSDPHARLLAEQLEAALAALAAGQGDPIEVVALAGLLERLEPVEPLLGRARPVVVAPEQIAASADDAAEALLAVDDDDDPAESWDALSALDEACAAASFLRAPEAVEEPVDDAVRYVRAFPEPWRAHAAAATALLLRQPPLPADPARRLWAAVEASRFAVAAGTEGAPARTLEALGLPVVISLAAFAGPRRLAAGSDLPSEAPWRTLAAGAGWELALTTDDDDRPIVLLAGAAARWERDGRPVAPSHTLEGEACAADPGPWRVVVGEREVRFEVRP